MSRHNPAEIQRLRNILAQYEAQQFPLSGISINRDRDVFIKQVIDSTRRVNFVSVVAARPLHPDRANPQRALFEPIRAALIYRASGNLDEACWLVFLFVHFGRHRYAGWRFVREVYGKLGQTPYWTWARTSANPQLFRDWLRQNQQVLLRGSQRGFGNHRKYTSMDADKPAGTGLAVQSYVGWVMNYGGHGQLIQHALGQNQADPRRAFGWLYHSMTVVASFGRTAKFDYLTMLGKMGLAQVEPGLAYLAGATGPVAGARAMLQGNTDRLSIQTMENRLIVLAQYLGVGMQVIEDSLCNWQKSPSQYRLFSG